MSEHVDFWETVRKICEKTDRFKPDAYGFVMQSLEFTIQRFGKRRHVSATELLEGLCDYAKDQYGLLAHTVITSWGIRSARDVGLVVYYLIDAGALSRQAKDQFEDFEQDVNLKRILEDEYFDTCAGRLTSREATEKDAPQADGDECEKPPDPPLPNS